MAPQSSPAPKDAGSDCFMDAVLDEARTFVQSVSNAPVPGLALIEIAEIASNWCLDINDGAKRLAYMILFSVFGKHLRKPEDTMRLSRDLRAMNAKGLFRCIQKYAPLPRYMEHALFCPREKRDSAIDSLFYRAPFIFSVSLKFREL